MKDKKKKTHVKSYYRRKHGRANHGGVVKAHDREVNSGRASDDKVEMSKDDLRVFSSALLKIEPGSELDEMVRDRLDKQVIDEIAEDITKEGEKSGRAKRGRAGGPDSEWQMVKGYGLDKVKKELDKAEEELEDLKEEYGEDSRQVRSKEEWKHMLRSQKKHLEKMDEEDREKSVERSREKNVEREQRRKDREHPGKAIERSKQQKKAQIREKREDKVLEDD